MTNIAAGVHFDASKFMEAGAHAGGGWWAAVVVMILVLGGGWLMKYFISRQEVLITALGKVHDDQTQLLVGVIRDNTRAMNEQSNAFGNLKTAVESRLSVRSQNG
jgi:hypothetical protein